MDTTSELHLLSLSGGKDSVAAALYLREQGIDHRRVFLDTGWEHPVLYEHLDYLEEVLGPIDRVRGTICEVPDRLLPEVEEIESLVGTTPSAFVRLMVSRGMFPQRRIRFCTQELKVLPFLRFVESLDCDVINVLGIRADESAARAKLPERELMPGAEHIEVWRPLIRWSEADVIAIHQRHGVRPCPLYLRGASRVGCWPCIQSNKAEVALLGKDDRRVEAIRRLEALLEREKRKRYAEKGDDRPFLAPRLFQGRKKGTTSRGVDIDDALAWAATERGGRQFSLDTTWGREAGCVRWGMCETLPENER